MMQNVAWKQKKTRWGIVVPSRGSKPTPLRNAWSEAADDRAVAVERERVADERPGDRGHGERGDAHHERVQGVLRAHEAGVEQAEPDRHEQDERGGDEHPGGVAGVDLGGRGEQAHLPTGVTAPWSVSPVRMRTARSSAHDEDLAVADLAGLAALAERVDRRLDELLGDRDLEAHLLRQAHLHARAAIGLDALELAAVALHAAHREAAHLGAVEGLEHVVGLVRSDDPDDELHARAAGRSVAARRPRLVMVIPSSMAYRQAPRRRCIGVFVRADKVRRASMARMYKDRPAGLDRCRAPRHGCGCCRSARRAGASSARAHSEANSAPNTTTFADA